MGVRYQKRRERQAGDTKLEALIEIRMSNVE